MNESEQAHTIEDIRGRIEYDTESDRDGGPFIEDLKSEPLHQDRIDLLKIVDSQAQKIQELQGQIDYLNGAIEKSDDERAKKIAEQAADLKMQTHAKEMAREGLNEAQRTIAEQEKELEEARAIADAHRDTVMAYKFGNQPQRDDFPDESRIRNPWEKQ